MTAPVVESCEFCHGWLVVDFAEATIVCPAHPELHDQGGHPLYTVQQVAGMRHVTYSDQWSFWARVRMIVAATALLWGLIVLTVLNPAAGLLAGCAGGVILVAIWDGPVGGRKR
ncbi:hypothetical protein [uncultured Friedmanniella sp.]|uniref:hypothetical protein n=1 Tax=uncultured Friedmanniella sp. TaxID=335381 RepID=UPI0035C977B3